MTLGRVNITANRWPWQRRRTRCLLDEVARVNSVGQRYGWLGSDGMGRFGGGWNWKLGFAVSKYEISIDLLFGNIRISWYQPEEESQP